MHLAQRCEIKAMGHGFEVNLAYTVVQGHFAMHETLLHIAIQPPPPTSLPGKTCIYKLYIEFLLPFIPVVLFLCIPFDWI